MATIKRIAEGVITHCTFCKALEKGKVLATWRITGANNTACDDHKVCLEVLKKKLNEANDDSHHSEADYQTWMRL